MSAFREGLVIGLEANRPTVADPEGKTYRGWIQGRVRHQVGELVVGDRVRYRLEGDEAVVAEVLPRQNRLVRPPLANVTGLFAVFSLHEPRGNRELLDKRLVMAHIHGLQAEVIINKVDLEPDPAPVDAVAAVYRQAGYRVWTVSALYPDSIAPWLASSRQGIWVLTGESGVGKSALIRAAVPEATTLSQSLSRIGRGRQTTRTVRLWPIGSWWLADSPGYTQLQLRVRERRQILEGFPEFAQVRCRYPDCWHLSEPGCEVRAAVEAGHLDPVRYRSYCRLLEEWYVPWE
ncbi:MAG: ribosome small subunit-dependent GTPase A [Firmicutes bacterium]|nr:ribosome small subunit-dependent GTPase A [Alicyclobacillaceae bacterium]MCL6496431.1 ribosome small subunit-dependent GTPase A [Bacillota bacterium]